MDNGRRNLGLLICAAGVAALGYQLQHRYGIRQPAKAYGGALAAVVVLVRVPVWNTIGVAALAVAGIYVGVL